MLAAVMVHPTEKVVLPFAPEPITKDDGDAKKVTVKEMLLNVYYRGYAENTLI